MTNLSTLKKEAIADFPKAAIAGENTNYDSKGVQMFLDELLDKVVEAVEESVMNAVEKDSSIREPGSIQEAFTNFKK